jgi:transposase
VGKIRIPIFNKVQIQELENGYCHGKSHALRQRCHIVLLKQQGHSSKHITSLKGYPKHQTTINNWVTRYEQFGIIGLKNKQGQGRKSILNPAIHRQKVEEIVKSERQRLDYAKSLIEQELDVKMNKKTLTRFLKTLSVLTEE